MMNTKRCACCGIEKPLSEFYPDKRRKAGVCGHCKDCHLAKCKKWYANLSDDEKEKYYQAGQKLIASNPARQAKRLESGRKWRIANPEKAKLAWSRYGKEHRDKRNEIDRRRQARLINAPGDGISAIEEKQLREEYNHRCAYCNEIKPFELDHIEPLRWGGAHDISNATVACKSCNSSKGDKTLLRFLASRNVNLTVSNRE